MNDINDDASPSKNQNNDIDTISSGFIPHLHPGKETSPVSSSDSAPSTVHQQKKPQHILSNDSFTNSSRRIASSHSQLNSSLNSSHLRLHNRQSSMGTISNSATPSTLKRHYEESSGIGSQASSIERMPPPPSRQSNVAAVTEVGILDIRDNDVPHGTYIFA